MAKSTDGDERMFMFNIIVMCRESSSITTRLPLLLFLSIGIHVSAEIIFFCHDCLALMNIPYLYIWIAASTEERDAEFKLSGGHSISQTGMTNSSDNSLLAWKTNRKKGSTGWTGGKSRNEDETVFVHPADTTYNKTPTKEDARGFLFNDYHWSAARVAQYSKPSPFDVDPDHSPYADSNRGNSGGKKNGATGSPKPLSALVSPNMDRDASNGGGSGAKSRQPKTLLELSRSR
jgi:hypothetical protein